MSGMVNNLAGQICNSADPQSAFNSLLAKNPDYRNGMNIVAQYGNGDPRTAFFSYAQTLGKTELAKQILSNLGLQ